MSKEELRTITEASQTLVTTKEVEACMLPVRGQQVLIDRDVAALYGVETKRINEAVRNNLDKFPEGYIFELTEAETEEVKAITAKNDDFADEKFDRKTVSSKTRYAPKAFTDRGLYMLATILKSPRATQTTIAIIDTFAKVKELSRCLSAMKEDTDMETKQSLVQRTGTLLNELIQTDDKESNGNVAMELNMMSVSLHVKKNKK
jgi:enoyl reductase-like protein